MKSIKEHIGFVVGSGVSPLSGHSMNAATAITKIAAAEAAGVRQIWMNQEYLDTYDICSCRLKNNCGSSGNRNCTDLSTSPIGFGPAGFGFE